MAKNQKNLTEKELKENTARENYELDKKPKNDFPFNEINQNGYE